MLRKLAIGNLLLLALLLATLEISAFFPRGVAQVLLSTLRVVATDPVIDGDTNNRRAVDFNCTTNSKTSTAGNFSDENCAEINFTGNRGQYSYGSGTNAKKTMIGLAINENMYAAAQRIGLTNTMNCWGVGDCAAQSTAVNYFGGPRNGDEGQTFGVVSYLQQAGCNPGVSCNPVTTTIASVPGQTTCNTTITQPVSANSAAQAVTVASTTGCNVNDWIVINHGVSTGAPNTEALQITAVGGSTVTGVFVNNYVMGTTVTPALVLNLNSIQSFGEGRSLVNMSATPYTTGTVSSISGGGFIGTGTGWSVGMVGGNQVICETTTTTWAAGNTVEAAITPFPDVNGFYYDMANWTAGNGALRGFLNVTNIGARTYGYGISLGQNMPSGSNSDAPIGWDSGIIFQNVNTGVRVITAAKQAMLLGCGADCGGTTDRNGRIAWGNGNDAFIGPNSPNHGIDFQWNTLVAGGTPGLMQGKQASVIGSGSLFELSFNGYLRLVATTFSALPTCAGAIEGAEASLTDANASAFGANITAGGGANHVKAYCNGTNWTVH